MTFYQNSLEILKKLHAAGVERVVTTKAESMHTEWMKEVEKINFPELMTPTKAVEVKKTEAENVAARALRLLPQEPPKMLTDGSASANVK